MSKGSAQSDRIRRLEAGFEGRLERLVGHDPRAVWRMLTEPQALAQWLDLGESGPARQHRHRVRPTTLLEYSWSSGNEPERPLRWELNAVKEGTQLVLTVRLPAGEDIVKACAGFDAHLEMLAAALEGVPIRFPVDRFLKARRIYQEMQPK